MLAHLVSGQNVTIRRFLHLTLVGQVLLAGLLLMTDMDARWLPGASPGDLGPQAPVSPGDQTRRFDPRTTRPNYTDRDTRPEIDLPSDLPQKLEFSITSVNDRGDILVLHGPIEPGDSRRFTGFLAGLETAPDSVALNSPGGAVTEALAIGRSIRAAGLDTVMLSGMACMSSCPYILASGTERQVSRSSMVGMHQHYYEAPGYMPVYFAVEDIQQGQGETVEYLIEMGVDPGLIVYSLKTPPDEIYLLVEAELIDTLLATEMTE